MSEVDRSTIDLLSKLFPFSTLDETDLERLGLLVTRISLNKGTRVYSQGEIAETFYSIISGNITIETEHKGRHREIGSLTTNEYFGEDALSARNIRTSSAVSSTKVELLRFSRKDLQQLRSTNPMVNESLLLFLRTYELTKRYSLPWKTHNENIELISRRHPIFFFTRVLLIGFAALGLFSLLLYLSITVPSLTALLLFLAIFSLGIGFLLAAWAGYEWTNDFFIITTERVLVQRKMIGLFDSRQESPISAILSTGRDTTLFGRIVGFGTITLRSYTGELKFKRLPYPETIFDFLEFRRQQISAAEKVEEQGAMRETLIQRLSTSPTMPIKKQGQSKNLPITDTYSSGSFSDFLAKFFNLRTTKEDSVIYRTHWWILIKKTTLPTLFLLAIVFAVLAKMMGFFTQIPDSFIYLVGLLLALGGWGWWFYNYLDWHYDIYIITNDQLVDVSRKPLGNEDRRSAPVKNIQTVEFERKGLIGLMLNFGTVKIQIGNEELTFDNVYNPSAIQSEIYLRFKEYSENLKRNDQQRLAEWIKTYDDLQKTGQIKRNPPGNSENR
jgi:hypothetical protein